MIMIVNTHTHYYEICLVLFVTIIINDYKKLNKTRQDKIINVGIFFPQFNEKKNKNLFKSKLTKSCRFVVFLHKKVDVIIHVFSVRKFNFFMMMMIHHCHH